MRGFFMEGESNSPMKSHVADCVRMRRGSSTQRANHAKKKDRSIEGHWQQVTLGTAASVVAEVWIGGSGTGDWPLSIEANGNQCDGKLLAVEEHVR